MTFTFSLCRKSAGSFKPGFYSMIVVLPSIGSVGYKVHPCLKKKIVLFDCTGSSLLYLGGSAGKEFACNGGDPG